MKCGSCQDAGRSEPRSALSGNGAETARSEARCLAGAPAPLERAPRRLAGQGAVITSPSRRTFRGAARRPLQPESGWRSEGLAALDSDEAAGTLSLRSGSSPGSSRTQFGFPSYAVAESPPAGVRTSSSARTPEGCAPRLRLLGPGLGTPQGSGTGRDTASQRLGAGSYGGRSLTRRPDSDTRRPRTFTNLIVTYLHKYLYKSREVCTS